MLAAPVRVAGVVTDAKGTPLAGVSIDHTGIRSRSVETDAQGRFDIGTRAPAIVFRKIGYQSKYWRVSEDRALAITLSGVVARLADCAQFSKCVTLSGWSSEFCFPRIRGTKVSEQVNDIDYGARLFSFKIPGGRVWIRHGSGPMWGPGWPLDSDVWSATNYSEKVFSDHDGHPVIDARGESSDGKYWRSLGHFGESAAYREVSKQDAALLDRVLDGVCLVTPK